MSYRVEGTVRMAIYVLFCAAVWFLLLSGGGR